MTLCIIEFISRQTSHDKGFVTLKKQRVENVSKAQIEPIYEYREPDSGSAAPGTGNGTPEQGARNRPILKTKLHLSMR